MERDFHHVGEQPGTQAIDRAAALLVWVLDAERPGSIADLAKASGLAKSTVSRTVSALVRFGLLERVGSRGPVRPGPVMQRYASRSGGRGLAELARPSLERLSSDTHETVDLTLPRASAVETIAQIDSSHIVGANHWVGQIFPLHCTAAGKVFLAFGPAQLPETLEACTPHTITDHAELERQLEAVAAAGWAEIRDELEIGLTAIAAPVRGRNRETVASLAISGPSTRLTHERCAELAPSLMKEAGRLSEMLGFSVAPTAHRGECASARTGKTGRGATPVTAANPGCRYQRRGTDGH